MQVMANGKMKLSRKAVLLEDAGQGSEAGSLQEEAALSRASSVASASTRHGPWLSFSSMVITIIMYIEGLGKHAQLPSVSAPLDTPISCPQVHALAICGIALLLRRDSTDIDSAYEPDEPASTSAVAAEPEELVVGRIYRHAPGPAMHTGSAGKAV